MGDASRRKPLGRAYVVRSPFLGGELLILSPHPPLDDCFRKVPAKSLVDREEEAGGGLHQYSFWRVRASRLRVGIWGTGAQNLTGNCGSGVQ